jgi:hypothetical protein
VKGKFRRRSFRIATVALATMAAGLLSAGCSSTPKSQPKQAEARAAKKTPEGNKAAVAESTAQKAAQREWCTYLEALYMRAVEGAGEWPKRAECMSASTLAAPEMLQRTARCSREALDRFEGDPFTSEYAAEVSRCGAEAIDSVEASNAELTPFVAAICGRMSACGDASYAECRDSLEAGLGPHLERAVGAMNGKGRAAFRVCLSRLQCGDLGNQLVGCLEPIMDGLLWLPG